jgi:putative ABC transport system permease protein
MPAFNRLVSGLRALVSRGRLERELDEELRTYFDAVVGQKMASGISRSEAVRQASVEIGGVEAVKEVVRDVGWERHVDAALQDLRFAVRWLVRAPRFTIPALLTLALGIGGTSAIFSVVRGVMLEPLPYRDPARIVAVWETGRGGTSWTSRNPIAPANYVVWRERTRSFERLGMVRATTVAMVVDGPPEKVDGVTVSADVFGVLGVQPASGRAFTEQEDHDPGNSVVVLGHEFWHRRLGGRSDVIGSTLTTDGRRRVVIGVMPPGFTVTGRKADFLLPYGVTIEQLRAFLGRGSSYGIARLRQGVSLEQAAAEMRSLAAQLEKEAPQRNARRTVMVFPLHEQMVGDLRPAALALSGAVLLVLLVACVNVANLLLARCAARERELGMRTALGASRGRLVRQMLTESVVLAAAGGAAGLLVAVWFHRSLLTLVGDRIPIPRLDQVALDLPMVALTMAIALATGVIFGLAPAFISTSRADEALRDGGRHGSGRRLRRALGALVVVEVALSLVLLAGAGLLLRSFVKLQSVDPGFRTDGVLAAQVQLPPVQDDTLRATRFFRESLLRISALPGVRSAAGVACLPLAGSCIGTSVWRLDRPAPQAGQAQSSQVRPVTPASFRTLGIPQVDGRDFSDADTADSRRVAIVSESFARLHFDGDNPMDRALHINNVEDAKGKSDSAWTIVGIVGDIKGSSLDADVRPTVYVPHTQIPSSGLTIVVRSDANPLSYASDVSRIPRSLDSTVLVSDVRPLADFVGITIARPRAISVVVGVFALVALGLAAVGVYGVMAYSVLERTQEIGIRMALGSSAWAVFRYVLGQGLRLVAIGIAAGLIAAAALTRLLAGLLFQVEPLDPWTFVVTTIVLLSIATLGSYVPARRSMRVAPGDALRAQ